ncbi:unnamed protein product [Mytilus coruscus]|uniref:Ig-like domain-containing protein n=1 Tax=Mytilus coruscus TaxID=42192 RepID=A0A6J8CHP9_MYTCO|nr:unnamed protein product [Mytilus coruscus]
MEDKEVIRKVDEPTDWVNSLVVVEKPKTGKLRICLDPRNLNKAIKREHFALPTIEAITTRLTGAKYLSKLDCNNGYWQLRMDKESQLLTSLACVSSKNNTTFHVCVGEDVTLSCPPAGFNKTVSWFMRNMSNNSIIKLYGLKGKDTHLQSNIAVDVNVEKGESNLTVNNLSEADNGTYKCLHDHNLMSWLFHLELKDPDHRHDNSGSQTNRNNMSCSINVSTYKSDDVPNMMWWYVMCCGLAAAGLAIVSFKYPTPDKGRNGGNRPKKDIIVV